MSNLGDLGDDLPDSQPGCGAKNVEPGIRERLEVQFGDVGFASRAIELGGYDDPLESCFERGWTDGLPSCRPLTSAFCDTERNLRDPQELVGKFPELRQCRESCYQCGDGRLRQGTSGRIGSIRGRVDPTVCDARFTVPLTFGPDDNRQRACDSCRMNSGVNALGQGIALTRLSVGSATLIRNVGGGKPMRSTARHWAIRKSEFCFAEDESDASWTPVGCAPGST